MDLKNLPPDAQFVFMAMMKSAMLMKERGKDKAFFVSFAEETWNSMEMSDFEYLKEVVNVKMRADIEPFVEKYIKSRRGKDRS